MKSSTSNLRGQLGTRSSRKFSHVIILKFEQYRVMHPKVAKRMANSVGPDQTVIPGLGQSDLGLHHLPRSVCPKT